MKINMSTSLIAQQALYKNTKNITKLSEQLASLKKINRAQDGPAEMAIATKMHAQIRGLEQAKTNAAHGQAALKIAEGTFGEITEIVQKQRELALKGANDTLTSAERAKLEVEYNSLNDEIKRIAGSANFNGMNVVDATASGNKFGVTTGGSTLHIGANNTSNDKMNISYTGISIAGVTNVSSPSTSAWATKVDDLDNLLESLMTDRTKIGTFINRLDSTINNLDNQIINTTDALATIENLDVAKASAQMLNEQIKQNASLSMLQSINGMQANVLALLQGL